MQEFEFDPNRAAPKDSGIFGLPYSIEEAKLILIPVPWEVTTSYGRGTAGGPQAIMQASKQIDLFDMELGNFFQAGIAMLSESPEVRKWNKVASKSAQKIIAVGGPDSSPKMQSILAEVNAYSVKLNDYVYTTTKHLLAQGKLVGLVGGDHSTPLGAIQAFLEKYPNMGILHFDAHADLRNAFEGFEYSHASIMYNVMTKTALKKLVQVGIRDFCEEEWSYIKDSNQRITTFFDTVLSEKKLNGVTWSSICDEIINCLPQEVYISFDIDGLDPRFCPHTGTPVPGGLELREAYYLIKKVAQSGRTIIGFDLNEVSPSPSSQSKEPDAAAEWDANVGARLLYKLCGWVLSDSAKPITS